MSLVADYGSDSESSDTENSQQVRGPVATKPSSFASQLPPPKVDSGDSSPVKTDVARPVSTKTKRDGPVRIFVDLPKPSAAGDDSDSDAEEHKSKKPRLAPGFSGLAALLPAPKNERTMSSSKGSLGGGASKPVGGGFVPYSLTKKKDNMVTDGKGKGVAIAKADETKVEMAGEERKAIDEFEDEGEEEELNSSTVKSFFPLGPSITAAPPIDLPADEPEILPSAHPIQPSEPAAYVPTAADAYSYDPNAAYTYDANNTTCYYDADAYPVESGAAAQQQGGGNAGIDDSVLAKLGGFRRGEPANFEIKDINRAQQIQQDAWAPPPQSATPVPSGSSNIKVSGMQKRKHNLLYLAAQAKDMEQKLMESYANNRKTKRETQGKYGF